MLLLGFACSEAWRAPSSIIINECSPKDMGCTAISIHLFIRNLIGSVSTNIKCYLSNIIYLKLGF